MSLRTDPLTNPPTKGKIYVLPTRYGYTFIAVLATMLVGSVNYSNNLGFILTFLLGGMALVAIVHTCRNIAGVRILDVRARPVFAGEPAVFECRVRSDRHPAAAVRLAARDGRSGMKDMDTDEPVRFRIQRDTSRRGILKTDTITIFSRYPLGLFRAWTPVPVYARCLVYPRPLHGSFDATADPGGDGSSGRAVPGGVDDFQGLRSFQPGDSLQHISWKAFSRGQGLLTKVFTGQAGDTVMLDWSSVSGPDVESRLSRLCGMILFAHRNQWSYGLRLPGRTIRAHRGDAHRQNCLKALALYGVA